VMTQNLLAVQGGKRDDIPFLGHLCTFHFPEIGVLPSEMDRAFQVSGLDRKFAPRPRSPRDAFRSAMERDLVRGHDLGNNRYLNLSTRLVSKTTDETLVYVLLREIVDDKSKQMEAVTQIARLLHHGENFMEFPEVPFLPIESQAMVDLETRYQYELTHFSNVHIRDTVQRVFAEANPISIRSGGGGVYFAPIKKEDTVHKVRSFVKALEPLYQATSSRPARFWSIPLVDGDDHRLMIQENLEDAVASEVKNLVKDMADILQDSTKTPTRKRALGFFDKIRDMTTMIAEYETTLQVGLSALHAQAKLAEEQAVLVLSRAN